MENNRVIKRNFVTDLFQFCVKSIKMLQKTNLPTEYDNFNEKQRHNYNNIMINFLLFVAKKQTDPSFRDMFARLAFYLYVFLENAGSVQSGGVRILRGNVVMDVNDNEIQPGDVLLQYVQGGLQLGQQVVQYAAPLYNQAQQQMVVQPPQQMIAQPPQQMVMDRDEQFRREMIELEQERLLEEGRGRLDILRARRQLMRGEVPVSQHALNTSASVATGFCCALFMNTSTNLSSNAFQNVGNLLKDAVSGAGEAISNAGDLMIPNSVKTGVKAGYNTLRTFDDYVASFFTSASSSAGGAANTTLSNLVNSTTNVNVGLPDPIQQGFFERVWDNMIVLGDKLQPGDLSDSASQCGLCCCVGTFTCLTYGTIQRAKNTQLRIIEGGPLHAALNHEANERNQNFARIAAGVGAAGMVAIMGPAGIPPAMGLVNTANVILNNPVNNVDNQAYPQLAPVQVQAAPQPILLEAPQPVQQIENVGLRQRNVGNNQGHNGGYQKFKKTKKSKRNNRKTRKMKRNNRKSRKYKKSKK